MTKTLRKSIMKRSQLDFKFYKIKLPSNKKAYNKQNNFVSRLYKKESKIFYKNLNIKDISDIGKFGKMLGHFFRIKVLQCRKLLFLRGKQ